jgi:hypothetical protein
MHYERKRRGREIGGAEPQRRPSGAGHISKQGYVTISVQGRTVLQHRHIMEELLGRGLADHETVHHINGLRSDNGTEGPLQNYRSGNLELWSHWQPCGQRVIDKVSYAIEILDRYLPEALAAQLPLAIPHTPH